MTDYTNPQIPTQDTSDGQFTIRTLKGDNTENLNIQYSPLKLSYGKRLEIRAMVDVTKFAEYDFSSVVAEGDKPKTKSIDIAGLNQARDRARVELVNVLFGLQHIGADNIVAEDYQKLVDYIIAKNPAGLEQVEKKGSTLTSTT